jgi:hypothetical protein
LKEAGAESLSFQLLNRNVDQPLKYVANERSGQAAAGASPLRGTKSSQTLRWREMDSNPRSPAKWRSYRHVSLMHREAVR